MRSRSAPTHASEFWSMTNWLPRIAPQDTHMSCLNTALPINTSRAAGVPIAATITAATITTTTIVMATMMAMATMFIIIIKQGACLSTGMRLKVPP